MLGEIPAGTHLRAYYKLENVNDSSGNGFTLTNNNTVLFNSGKLGNAADFGSSGINKGLNRSGSILLGNPPTDFYMSFLFKLNSIADTTRDHILCLVNATDGTSYQVRYSIASGVLRIKSVTGTEFIDVTADLNWHLIQLRGGTVDNLIYDRILTVNPFNQGTGGSAGVAVGNAVAGLTLQAFAKVDELIVSEGLYAASTSEGQSARTKYFTQLKGRFCI